MLLLTSTTDKLQVVTGAATAVGVHASWVDLSGSTVTPGRGNTSIASATTTDVVASPAASTTRNVKFFSVWNDATSGTHTITVRHTDGTTTVDLWQGTLPAQSGVTFDEATGWRALSNAQAADVQTFDAPGGVWTKPTGLPTGLTLIRLWGGGGGGGGAASLATTAIAKGGAGGGGSACISQLFLTDELPSQLRVIIGFGGAGGAGAAAGGSGSTGAAGQSSIVRTAQAVLLTSFGGTAGAGGTNISGATAGGSGTGIHNAAGNAAGTAAAGMIGVNGTSSTSIGPTWEGGGGGGGSSNSSTVPAMIAGANSRWGAGGGGAGGCHTSTLGMTTPSAGGGTGNSIGGTAGGNGGAAGTNGASPTAGANGTATDGMSGGHGGGGGGTTIDANVAGAAGGNGGKGGGGGGGGGVGMNPGIGGAGGNGGDGYGVILSW